LLSFLFEINFKMNIKKIVVLTISSLIVVSCSSNVPTNTVEPSNVKKVEEKLPVKTDLTNVINNQVTKDSNTKKNTFKLKSIPVTSEGYNEEAYLAAFPDVYTLVKNSTYTSGYAHYLAIGKNEGRLSNPAYPIAVSDIESGYNEKAYLLAFPSVKADVDASVIQSGYVHYLNIGKNAGLLGFPEYILARDGTQVYDSNAYLIAYPDAQAAVTSNTVESPYVHYLTTDVTRIETPQYIQAYNEVKAGFDEESYLLAFPEIEAKVKAGIITSAYDHYNTTGKNDGWLALDAYKTAYDCKFGATCNMFVTNFIPTVASPGDSIILGGKYFKTNPTDNQVFFSDSDGNQTVPAVVTKALVDRLTVTVPANALDGWIKVVTPNGQATSLNEIKIVPKSSSGSNIVNLSSNELNSTNVSIASNNLGVVTAVWEDKNTAALAWDVFSRDLKNNVLSSGENVTRVSPNKIQPKNPSVAIDDTGKKHIVFLYGGQIYYMSTDNTGAWIAPSQVGTTNVPSTCFPKISVSPGFIHVIWSSQNELAYRKSADGVTWESIENASNNVGTNSINPSIVTDSRDIPYVAWEEVVNNTRYIMYSRKFDANWMQPFPISTDAAKTTFKPSIALDTVGKPSIAWEQDTNGFRDIYYSKSLNREDVTQWSTPINISNTDFVSSFSPKITIDNSNNAHVVWEESVSGIFLVSQTNPDTNTWGTPEKISQVTGSKSYKNPVIAKDPFNNTIQAAWESNIANSLYDIFLWSKGANAIAPVQNRIVEVVTNHGIIKAVLHEDKMPITTKNFINLANSSFYSNLTFHRYVADFVIQGGDPTGTGTGGSSQTIPLEINPSVPFNQAGIFAMARTTEPDSATSQYFITLGAATHLNNQYAAFATMYSGFDVLGKLRQTDVMYSVNIVTP
jgi:peptidyl-prolyl cis-trans isomerase B (cyclophilin B)